MSAITTPARPGGVPPQVQFNDAGHFGGDAYFQYDKAARSIQLGAAPAGPGLGGRLRFSSTDALTWRNGANTNDIVALQVPQDNRIYVGSYVADAGLTLRSTTEIAVERGIRFPAAAVPSADPMTLDDYREGTFTPTIVGTGGSSGQAYNFQQGRYVKIGGRVEVWVSVQLATPGTNAGNVALNLLPFPAEAGTLTGFVGGSIMWQNLTMAFVTMTLFLAPGAIFATVYGSQTGGSALLPVPVAALGPLATFYIHLSYMTA